MVKKVLKRRIGFLVTRCHLGNKLGQNGNFQGIGSRWVLESESEAKQKRLTTLSQGWIRPHKVALNMLLNQLSPGITAELPSICEILCSLTCNAIPE